MINNLYSLLISNMLHCYFCGHLSSIFFYHWCSHFLCVISLLSPSLRRMKSPFFILPSMLGFCWQFSGTHHWTQSQTNLNCWKIGNIRHFDQKQSCHSMNAFGLYLHHCLWWMEFKETACNFISLNIFFFLIQTHQENGCLNQFINNFQISISTL